MARFTPGPIAGEIRGSIGAVTYSRNRYGAYMRVRVVPTVSVTSYALAAKAALTTTTQGWQALVEAVRLAWNQWAAAHPITTSLGAQNILTGHAAYVGINSRLIGAGAPQITDPPLTPPPIPLTSLSVAPDGTLDTCIFTFTATPLGANEHLAILATQQPSAGKVWVENLLKGGIFSGAAVATGIDLYTSIAPRIGDLVVGQFLHVKVAVFDSTTGLLSAPLRDSAVIV